MEEHEGSMWKADEVKGPGSGCPEEEQEEGRMALLPSVTHLTHMYGRQTKYRMPLNLNLRETMNNF